MNMNIYEYLPTTDTFYFYIQCFHGTSYTSV